MKYIFSLVAFMWLPACGSQNPSSKLKFYSHDALEADLTIEDYFTFPRSKLTGEYPNLKRMDQLSKEDQKQVRDALKLQILHLYGVFTYHEKPVDFSTYSGTIKESGTQRIKSFKANKNSLRIDYEYSDLGLFYQDLFYDTYDLEVEFLMPNSPLEIYKQSLPAKPKINPKTKEPINPCSDLHDNVEESFWYYWSPDRKGCPKKILRHLHRAKGRFVVRPQTEASFPEYRDFFQAGTDKEVKVQVLLGQDAQYGQPTDLGFRTYQQMTNHFKSLTLSNGDSTFYVEEEDDKHALLKYETDQFLANIHIDYIDTEAEDYDSIARNALETADLLIFSGHSAEGHYFDLNRLYKDTNPSLPIDKYQVMFFNACTTYAYYKENLFKAKSTPKDPNGTKSLDIITNGVGAPFLIDGSGKSENADMILVKNLLGINKRGRPLRRLKDWQGILGQITRNAGYEYTALTSIRGDEDNPSHLDRDIDVPKPL